MSQQNAPLTPWQAVMGFAPTRETPAAQLLSGAKKLVLYLRREYARCLAAWHQLGNPHARPYGLFGREDTPILLDLEPDAARAECEVRGAECQQPDPPSAPAVLGDLASSREPAVQHETLNSKPETCSSPPHPQSEIRNPQAAAQQPASQIAGLASSIAPPSQAIQPPEAVLPPNPQSEIRNPQSTACPFALWDPVFQIAAALALSECQLTRYCKLASGLSARQWWDLVKAQDPATGVVARLREELARDAAGLLQHTNSCNRYLDELIQHVQYERRMRGASAPGRALHWGYRNSARMQEAVFVLEGRTLAELEMEMLRGLYAEWRERCDEARRVMNEAANRESAALIARHEAALAARRAAGRGDGPVDDREPEYGDALPQDAASASAHGAPRAERTSGRDREDREGRENRVQRPRHRVTGYDF